MKAHEANDSSRLTRSLPPTPPLDTRLTEITRAIEPTRVENIFPEFRPPQALITRRVLPGVRVFRPKLQSEIALNTNATLVSASSRVESRRLTLGPEEGRGDVISASPWLVSWSSRALQWGLGRTSYHRSWRAKGGVSGDYPECRFPRFLFCSAHSRTFSWPRRVRK